MAIAEWVAVVQTTNGTEGTDPKSSNQTADAYFVIGLVALVAGLIVLVLIRTCARRASKRKS